MKKILSLLAFFVTLTTMAQMTTDEVQFTVKQHKVSDSEIELSFTGKMAQGWHVYGIDLPKGGPTGTSLTVEKATGVKPKGKLQGKGKLHRTYDKLFEMDLSYYEHSVTFVQRFEITAEKYELEGYLTYSACNNTSCMPPTDIDFKYTGTGKPQVADKVNAQVATTATDTLAADTSLVVDSASTVNVQAVDTANVQQSDYASPLWAPVVEELQSLGGDHASAAGRGIWTVFFLGLVGGFVALLTPCVWPIIPMTVSFFLKRSKDNRAKAIRDAVTYGLSIIVIYVSLGIFVTLIWGANALNDLSTNAFFNIFFFLMLVVFAASFLGGFELTLPSSWGDAVDSKANKTSGILSIFLMAFTLSLVSFSCTGPIIGFLLVEVGNSGSLLAPTVGMLGFAIALALPFTLFALFPTMLKSAPKSGNWMNCIKVCLGFLELAFALKFLSVADLAYGWHILDREVFLVLWIVIFALLGAYLIGWLRFPHDEDEYDEMGEVIVNHRTGVTRFFLAVLSFAFALYMVPGLWGAPCKAVSAFAPPMYTQDFNLQKEEHVEARFKNYEEGMQYAREMGLPVMLDFTGNGCVNCRKMEASVWTDPTVRDLITEDYVLITLYVDDKTPLPETEVVQENGKERKLRTVGDRWSYFQRVKFGANAQPFYVLLDNEGKPLSSSYAYNEDVAAYVNWLKGGLARYKK